MVDFVKLKESKDEKPQSSKRSKFTLKTFLLIVLGFIVISSIISSITLSIAPKIAVVPLTGPILTQEETTLYGTSLSSRSLATTLRELAQDETVKAVVLDINSPGGSPVASEEISLAVEKVKENKPIYALVNEVGASGAFWVAMSSTKVYASSMSTLGSIGVTSAGLSFEDFIKEHNISYRRLTSGEFKDMGSVFREQTEEEKEKFTELLNEIHSNFVSHVATSRNLSLEHVSEYATGEVFLGSKAKKLGFIDEIGYYPDVIEDLKNQTGEVIIVNYGPEPTLFDAIGISSSISGFFPVSSSSLMLLK